MVVRWQAEGVRGIWRLISAVFEMARVLVRPGFFNSQEKSDISGTCRPRLSSEVATTTQRGQRHEKDHHTYSQGSLRRRSRHGIERTIRQCSL